MPPPLSIAGLHAVPKVALDVFAGYLLLSLELLVLSRCPYLPPLSAGVQMVLPWTLIVQARTRRR